MKKHTDRKKAEKNGNKAAGSRALVKKMTPEEFDLVKGAVIKGNWSDGIIEKFGEDLLPSLRAGKLDMESMSRSTENFRKALTLYGLDTHFPLLETVDERYRPLVEEFSRQLIQEYDCKTSGEKALAEIVVSAYARILIYSQRLNAASSVTSITPAHIGFYSVISKELDRANRHFITALTTLKQIKAPSIEINVKTKTAFVAQNQQLNIGVPKKPPGYDSNNNDEIIDPK